MPRIAPSKTMLRAKRIHQSWLETDPAFETDQLNVQIYADQINYVEIKDNEILAAETHIKALRKARREARKIVHVSSKRIMSVAKGRYGDDSSQYKVFGGIPLSERAPSRRRSSKAANLQPVMSNIP